MLIPDDHPVLDLLVVGQTKVFREHSDQDVPARDPYSAAALLANHSGDASPAVGPTHLVGRVEVEDVAADREWTLAGPPSEALPRAAHPDLVLPILPGKPAQSVQAIAKARGTSEAVRLARVFSSKTDT